MNRSFLIIILPAVAVGIGYIVVLHWLGYQLDAVPFVMAGVAIIAAIVLVQWRLRRKAARRNH